MQKTVLLVVSVAIWGFYTIAALIDTWNIILSFKRPLAAYAIWSLGLSTTMTLVAIIIGDCLMVRDSLTSTLPRILMPL